jgi:hypothetical protein
MRELIEALKAEQRASLAAVDDIDIVAKEKLLVDRASQGIPRQNIIGYMDYDPKMAAKASRRMQEREGKSWFKL